MKVLLYNGQVTDRQTDKIKSLATSAGVPIVGVTETLPTGDQNFQAWQLRQDQRAAGRAGRLTRLSGQPQSEATVRVDGRDLSRNRPASRAGCAGWFGYCLRHRRDVSVAMTRRSSAPRSVRPSPC